MISLVLSKLYRIILENNINTWKDIHGKRDHGRVGLRAIIQLWTSLLYIGPL